MRTKIMLAGLSVALLAVPLVTSAATIASLQAELSGLLSQIQSLESGMGYAPATASGNAGNSLSGTVVSSCPVFNRSLFLGSSGNDVTTLQQYLQSQGDLSVSATGYFGALTKAALIKWQEQNSIAASGNAGLGIFGPLSRAYFSRNCGGTQPANRTLSADPRSGSAPLSVTFTTNGSIASDANYSVQFGDGTTGTMSQGSCVSTAVGGSLGCSYSISHTYMQTGTYTAELMKNTCPGSAVCVAGPLPVASTIVTVGSGSTTAASFTASPASGDAPLTVQFKQLVPQGNTLGTTINFGDGSTGTLGVVPVCSSCEAEGIATHTYASPGTYTATLTSGMCSCPANGICNCPNMMILGTATVTVTGTSTSSNIQQLNAPGSATLSQGGIAEIRNESFYFTLQNLTGSSASIQITPVGCWNSFPSDAPPRIICMLAMLPIPVQTLSIGQSYLSTNYGVTLTSIANNEATFSVTASSTAQY